MEIVYQYAPYVIALIVSIIAIISKIKNAKTAKEILVVVSNSTPEIFERVTDILSKRKMIKNERSQSSKKSDSQEV